MFGLSFETLPAVEPAHPARADIALLVGWTTRRATPLPAAIDRWLSERRYAADAALRDVPVPIDTWASFDALFDWHARPLAAGSAQRADDYLGLAVRDFFANGGRKAYVVRLGDPGRCCRRWTPMPVRAPGRAAAGRRRVGLAARSWRGVEHAWALEDASLVLVPTCPGCLPMQQRRCRPMRRSRPRCRRSSSNARRRWCRPNPRPACAAWPRRACRTRLLPPGTRPCAGCASAWRGAGAT